MEMRLNGSAVDRDGATGGGLGLTTGRVEPQEPEPGLGDDITDVGATGGARTGRTAMGVMPRGAYAPGLGIGGGGDSEVSRGIDGDGDGDTRMRGEGGGDGTARTLTTPRAAGARRPGPAGGSGGNGGATGTAAGWSARAGSEGGTEEVD